MLWSPLVALQWYRNRWSWMTLNGHFALKCVSGSATRLASPAFGQNCSKICTAIPIYCQRQKCSPSGNVVSGSIRFMQIFAGFRWRGGVNWEWGRWKWRFSLHSFTVFRTFYIHGHTTAFRWYDCQWPWAYFKVTGLFQFQGHWTVSHQISQKRCAIRQKLL